MARRFGILLLVALLAAVAPAAARAGCDPLWVRHVADAMADATPEVRQKAIQWSETFKDAETDEMMAQGMLKAVQEKELRAFLVSFDRLTPADIPFLGATRDEQVKEMYRALGRLAGPDFSGVDGLSATIGNLVSTGVSNQKGALLELRVADDLLAQGADRSLIGFQEQVRVPHTNALRKPDVVAKNSSGGYSEFHEAKNWPDGLQGQGSNFQYLREYADEEFPSDILLMQPGDFDGYRVDLREVMRGSGDAQILRDELLKKFDESSVVEILGATEASRLKKAFLNLSGQCQVLRPWVVPGRSVLPGLLALDLADLE